MKWITVSLVSPVSRDIEPKMVDRRSAGSIKGSILWWPSLIPLIFSCVSLSGTLHKTAMSHMVVVVEHGSGSHFWCSIGARHCGYEGGGSHSAEPKEHWCHGYRCIDPAERRKTPAKNRGSGWVHFPYIEKAVCLWKPAFKHMSVFTLKKQFCFPLTEMCLWAFVSLCSQQVRSSRWKSSARPRLNKLLALALLLAMTRWMYTFLRKIARASRVCPFIA